MKTIGAWGIRGLSPILFVVIALAGTAGRRRRSAGRARATLIARSARAERELHQPDQRAWSTSCLVERDKKLKLVPALATSWKNTSPTTGCFKLRQGVKFHDGTPFTADDVVFSFERARARHVAPSSSTANQAGTPRKIDDYTVEFTTDRAQPGRCSRRSRNIFIMSKAWARRTGRAKPQDFSEQGGDLRLAQRQGHRAVHRSSSREPDVKTVLKKNPNWWGIKAGYSRATSTTSCTRRSSRRDAHGGAALAARSTSCSTRRCRTSRGSREDAAHQGAARAPRTASSSSAWTRRATSSCTRTSRGRIRSRTGACARRSTRRSTSTRSRRR